MRFIAIFRRIGLRVEFRGELVETSEHSVKNGLGMERRGELKAQFIRNLAEPVGHALQVLMRDPGDELPGVGISFPERWVGMGATPGRAVPSKLCAPGTGGENFSAKSGHAWFLRK
jgi:hypothetical protein